VFGVHDDLLLGAEIATLLGEVQRQERRQQLDPLPQRPASPDISPSSVEARTALPLKCPLIEVSNLDERAGNAESKLYRTGRA